MIALLVGANIFSTAGNAYEFGCLDDLSASVSGRGTAVDGDSLSIGPINIDLIGIDAPENGQVCLSKEGAAFDCGKMVKDVLQAKLDHLGQDLTCIVPFVAKNGRAQGFCGKASIDSMLKQTCILERDVGGELARDGYAFVTAIGEIPTAHLYWDATVAPKNKVGLFAGKFDQPSNSQPWQK